MLLYNGKQSYWYYLCVYHVAVYWCHACDHADLQDLPYSKWHKTGGGVGHGTRLSKLWARYQTGYSTLSPSSHWPWDVLAPSSWLVSLSHTQYTVWILMQYLCLTHQFTSLLHPPCHLILMWISPSCPQSWWPTSPGERTSTITWIIFHTFTHTCDMYILPR